MDRWIASRRRNRFAAMDRADFLRRGSGHGVPAFPMLLRRGFRQRSAWNVDARASELRVFRRTRHGRTCAALAVPLKRGRLDVRCPICRRRIRRAGRTRMTTWPTPYLSVQTSVRLPPGRLEYSRSVPGVRSPRSDEFIASAEQAVRLLVQRGDDLHQLAAGPCAAAVACPRPWLHPTWIRSGQGHARNSSNPAEALSTAHRVAQPVRSRPRAGRSQDLACSHSVLVRRYMTCRFSSGCVSGTRG